jgi:FkbM family methyltransferase
MAIRDDIRRLRLYFKSMPLFQEHLESTALTWWLPFLPAGAEVKISMNQGRVLNLKAGNWPLLPSACRLQSIGAEFEFLAECKRVEIDGLTIYSPLWSREEASYYKEVLLDDVYAIKVRDLRGAVVVDVGAYVGDSVLAFARQGAFVHAVEPSVSFCGFIRKNVEANNFSDTVRLHEIGLSAREEDVASGNDSLHLVEGVGYTLNHLPEAVDVLKLDCEGAEYHLLADPRFLMHLRPKEIRMEYHRGKDPLMGYLSKAGYSVEHLSGTGPVGLLCARRSGRS